MQTNTRTRGSVLLGAMVVAALLAITVGSTLALVYNLQRMDIRTSNRAAAQMVADSLLEVLFANWQAQLFSSSSKSPLTTSAFSSNLTYPTSTDFPQLDLAGNSTTKITINEYSITAVVPDASNPGKWAQQDNATLRTTSGPAESQIYTYLATANVTARPPAGQPVTVKLQRSFSQEIESPWLYAIFYNDDLEMNPGAPQDIYGLVHTNADLYAASNQLSYHDAVSMVGSYYNYRKEDPATSQNANFDPGIVPKQTASKDIFGSELSASFSTADSNPNNDGFRELIERPNPSFTDPVANDRFYNKADVILIFNGDTLQSITTPKDTGTSAAVKNAIAAAFSATTSTLRDQRQGVDVAYHQVDVEALTNALKTFAASRPDGFVVYASDTTGSDTNLRAFKLINGQQLHPDGMTFVTDNPVYIKGDYNTMTPAFVKSSNPTAQPLSDTTAASNKTASPIVQKAGDNSAANQWVPPAAVLSDAVTILSNAWNDAQSSSGISNRTPTQTTINAGLISGICPSKSTWDATNKKWVYNASNTDYSGGSENYPRFLENWSGVKFTYYGSMVQLFFSAQAVKKWPGTGSVYNAPTRVWWYDTHFRTDPPPGYLLTVTLSKGPWVAGQ